MYMTTETRARIDLYLITICHFVTVTRGPQKTKLNERTNYLNMNKKTTSLKVLLPKIALLLALVVVATCLLSSCGSNTVIDTKTTAEEWANKEVTLTPEKNWLGHILSWIGIFLGWITNVMPANSYILTLFIFN